MKFLKIIVLFLTVSMVLSLYAADYIEFVPDDSPASIESKYLYKNEGSQFAGDNGNHRWADGSAYFIYRIDLTGIKKDVIIVDVCHDYKVEMSFDDKYYFTVLETPNDVHDDSNRGDKIIDLKKYIKVENVAFLRFTDKTPDNGWGSCVYNVFVGNVDDKQVGKIDFRGETFFVLHNIALRGPATDVEFEREWFSFGYADAGELIKRAYWHQGFKLFLTAGVLNKYILNAELDIDKFNDSWDAQTWEPIGQWDDAYDKGAFVISLETIQEKYADFKHKLTIGRIYPEYTTLTVKKLHNGLMWESESSRTKIMATGARLKKFNNTSQYLATGRGETMLGDVAKIGATCVLSRYDTKSVASGDDNIYGVRDGSLPAVYLRFKDRTPHDWWGTKLWNVTVQAKYKGKTGFQAYENFQPGDDIEVQYLFDVHGNSEYSSWERVRQASENGYFIYRFPITEDVQALKFDLDVAQDYVIEYSLDGINYVTAAEGDSKSDDNRNIESFDVNLLPELSSASYVYVTISDDSPGDGWSGDLYGLEYYEDDSLKISFVPDDSSGSTEQKYLIDNGSTYKDNHRYADTAGTYFTYKLPISAGAGKIKLRLDIQNDYRIAVKILGATNTVVSAPGNPQNGINRGFVEIELNSYDSLYENTYIKTGTTIVGFDVSARIWDIDIKGEFARSIEHRVYPGNERKNEGFNAWFGELKRKFNFLDTEIKTEYFYIDPQYDASVSVDDNDDNDSIIDELEPTEVTVPQLEYDPLKDMDNNNVNDEDEQNTDPDYKYEVDQQGYAVQSISKLFRDLTGTLYFSEIQEISTDKVGQKMGSKLDLYKGIADSSLIGRYRIFYFQDKRSQSTNPQNLKNYFKVMYYYWGIKPFDMGMGMEDIWIDKNYQDENTKINTTYAVKSRCNLKPLNRLRFMPLFQILFVRKTWIEPSYDVFEEWNQYIPGLLLEYELAEKAKAYANYRYAYTYDIKYPINHHYYNMFEIGAESHGLVYIRVFYRFIEKEYIKWERWRDNWKSGNLFAEIKYWF